MDFNSSGYFAYKKSKIKSSPQEVKKPISRLSFIAQLFVATFLVMFIITVLIIMNHSSSSKVDIEYSQGDLQFTNGVINTIPNYDTNEDDEKQRKIDKRLILIQQEENAPSEARILNKPKSHQVVIDASHIQKNKKLEKIEKQNKLNKESEARSFGLDSVMGDKNSIIHDNSLNDNVVVMSKVLIGRYSTFEEAQKQQQTLKKSYSSLQPFVKKIGNAFSIQMGSYQDFAVAKKQAQELSAKGFGVWIYQQ